MDLEPYVLRVKYGQKIRFIVIPKTTFNITTFLDKAFETFNVDPKEGLKVQLFDNLSTPIHADIFELVVKSFGNGSTFFINLVYESDIDGAKKMVTPEILEKYLLDKNGSIIFVEFNGTGDLTEKTRRQLVNLLVDFMRHVFGKVRTDHKIVTAKAAIILFPCLVMKESEIGGIDKLYNPINGGYLTQRLKYLATVDRKRSSEFSESAESGDSEDEKNNEGNAAEIFEKLKSTIVKEENWHDIENGLRSCREYRSNLLKITRTDLLENFPYFFAHPKLILFEFSDRFPQLDSKAYINAWPRYSAQLQDILRKQYATLNFHTQWSEEIQKLFILIKLLPTKFGRKVNTCRETFQKTTEKLIVFRPHGTAPIGMINDSNTSPYIVAYGNSMKEISNFYIEVEKHLICMPKDFGILETFDILFKIHKIFEQNYDPNLKGMFSFIQNYIYKLTERDLNVTARMMDIFGKLTL